MSEFKKGDRVLVSTDAHVCNEGEEKFLGTTGTVVGRENIEFFGLKLGEINIVEFQDGTQIPFQDPELTGEAGGSISELTEGLAETTEQN